MRYLVLAAAILTLPSAALAQQVDGTVNITGTVAGRCSVLSGGQSFADTIDLGELAGSDGRLRTDLTDATQDGLRSFSVVCTSATPRVRVNATQLATAATAPTGYSNAIDYTANVAVTQASGTAPTITYTTSATPPPATNVALTAPLSASAGNVVVTIYSFATPGNALLVAGAYSGVVSITISPS